MQQVALLANVASPESLLSLTDYGAQLQENISAVKDMIILKRVEAEKSEELHSQVTLQNIKDPSPKESDFSNTQGQHGSSSSHIFPKAKELHEDSSDHEDLIKDLQDFKHLAERTEDWLKKLQQSDDTQETDTQNILTKNKARLQKLKVKKKKDA